MMIPIADNAGDSAAPGHRRKRRPRPPLNRLGVNPVSVAALAGQLGVLLLTLIVLHREHIAVEPFSATRVLLWPAAFVPWIYFAIWPGRENEWAIPDSIAALLLISTCSVVSVIAQYAALSLGRPFIDAQLARADAALGISVPAMVLWLAAHPRVTSVLVAAYSSYQPQVLLGPFVIAFLGDRRALWVYVCAYHLSLAVALGSLVIWPSEYVYAFYRFTPLIPDLASHAHANLVAIRSGQLPLLRLGEAQGLISMPSFHAVIGMLIPWSLRGRLWLVGPLAIIDVGLLIATVVLGLHYVVDVLATLIGFPIVVYVSERIVSRALGQIDAKA
jgi:hypothetical protein